MEWQLKLEEGGTGLRGKQQQPIIGPATRQAHRQIQDPRPIGSESYQRVFEQMKTQFNLYFERITLV